MASAAVVATWAPASSAGAAAPQLGRALVVGSNDNGFEGNTLRNDLEKLGLDVDRQASVPTDLTAYQSVWYVEAYEGLNQAEVDSLVTYSKAGGNLYLTGERPCCETLNASVEDVLSRTLVDHDVQIGGLGDIDGPFSFNSSVTDYVATVPNFLVDFAPQSPGGIQGLQGVNTRNVLARSASVVVGAVWAERDMVAGAGRTAILMDIDWLGSEDRLPIIENLANFLSSGSLCFTDGSATIQWVEGPRNCSAINAPKQVTWSARSPAGAPDIEVTGSGVEVECTSTSAGTTASTSCSLKNAMSTGASLRVVATSSAGSIVRHYRVRPKNDTRNVPDGYASDSNWWDWPDADSDGIPDKWEVDGVWVKDQFLDLPSAGADPEHKDLFVRYDYEDGYAPSSATLNTMRAMFSASPLTNPDGGNGVRLHIDLGSAVPSSVVGDYDLNSTDIIRVGTYTGYLSSPEYGGSGVPSIYKSMINLAQKSGTSTIGRGFIKGQFAWTGWDVNGAWAAFNVNLPTWDSDARAMATSFAQASNAAHELGHLIGLRHHNDEDTPTHDDSYKSIMSYTYSNFGLPGSGFLPEHHIDYSRSQTPKLDWRMGAGAGRLTFVSGQDGEIGDFYDNAADDALGDHGEELTELTEPEILQTTDPDSILSFLEATGAPADPQIPTLTEASASVAPGEAVDIALTGLDPGGSDVEYLVDTVPTLGTVSATPNGLRYVADPSAVGSETLMVRASNGTLSSSSAGVTITIKRISAVAPPALSGSGKVGTALSFVDPVWDTSGAAQTYQWTRNGQPILAATARTYLVAPEDVGTAIRVSVTARRSGFGASTSTSAAVTATAGDAASAVKRPRVTGVPLVGHTLTATPGSWKVAGLAFGYQWMRGRSAIPGATHQTYRPTARDARKPLSVVVTASRPGYSSGRASSGGVAVRLPSSSRLAVEDLTVPTGHQVVARVKVSGASRVPTGVVVIRDGRKVVARVHLRHGKATVRIGGLAIGQHKIRAFYLGSRPYAGSRSRPMTVRIMPS